MRDAQLLRTVPASCRSFPALFHTEDGFLAVDDTCTHQDASLAGGWLEGCFVECPLHADVPVPAVP